MSKELPGTLQIGEVHPAVYHARDYIKEQFMIDPERMTMIRESIASTALSGNRAAEIANETWRRLDEGEAVSDRYLMGLAWFIHEIITSNPSDDGSGI